ncbi:MAG: LysR family transcriptional regulator [Betaproteobacteria bacterium]|nr:MAG: LysR family transcriptional regulator [Betaproteobacteria bacterium]
MADIRRIDLNLLAALDALLDERNVTRAAARLALTQPTLSGMLERLRDLFGDPLFVREQRGVLPTPYAQSLAPRVKQLLADAAALVAKEPFVPSKAEGVFSISVNDYMQSALMVPFAAELRRLAPRMRLAIYPLVIEGLGPRLAQGEFDLAVTIPEFSWPQAHARLLYRERYVCAVRARHPLKGGTVSLTDFCRYDHVLVSPTGGAFEGPADAALTRKRMRRRVALSVPSFLVLTELLQVDDLVAVVPEKLVRRRSRGLRVFAPPIEVPGFDVVAVWHPRMHQDPAHRWMRELLATVAGRMGT